ncbi:MAG: zinc-ribbon domain-containing protein [Candidatus Methanomethylophilaceae archaeon]|jgi:uncharacterized membrane protein YvbJ
MAKFCKNCGTLMSDDEKVCPYCGASKHGTKVPTTSVERSGVMKGKMIALCIAAAVLILGLLYFKLMG